MTLTTHSSESPEFEENTEAAEDVSEAVTEETAEAAADTVVDAGDAVESAEAPESLDTDEAVDLEGDEDSEASDSDETPAAETETEETPAETESDTPAAAEEPAESEPAEAEAADESEEAEVVEMPKPASPYDLPGDWYVIHSYSGYENKVKANLETRIQSMHMEDRIFEVHIPMEDVVEFKGGKKVTVPKKVFPGYILVRMSLDDDSWYAGNAQKPTPLSRREVERFLGVQEEEEKAKPRFKPEWDVGEQVRVVTGPFADFNGTIEELNIDQQKVVVLVNIFGRDTPVELGFEDIQKS